MSPETFQLIVQYVSFSGADMAVVVMPIGWLQEIDRDPKSLP